MANSIGSFCTSLDALPRLIEAHSTAAERLHADDTTMQALAKGKTDTEQCCMYVKGDRPFGGVASAAAMFYHRAHAPRKVR